jgi:hypothetical protein
MKLWKCSGCDEVFTSVVRICPRCGSKGGVLFNANTTVSDKRSDKYSFQISCGESRRKYTLINKLAEKQLKKMGLSDYPYNPDGTSKMSKIMKEKALGVIKDSVKGTPLENSPQLEDTMKLWGCDLKKRCRI